MSAATLASLADRLCVPTALCSMFKVLLPVHSHLPQGRGRRVYFVVARKRGSRGFYLQGWKRFCTSFLQILEHFKNLKKLLLDNFLPL